MIEEKLFNELRRPLIHSKKKSDLTTEPCGSPHMIFSVFGSKSWLKLLPVRKIAVEPDVVGASNTIHFEFFSSIS